MSDAAIFRFVKQYEDELLDLEEDLKARCLIMAPDQLFDDDPEPQDLLN